MGTYRRTTKTNSIYDKLLREAKQLPQFAALLDAVFKHPAAGRVLLISHSEMFPVITGKDGKVPFQFRATGLPYLSHKYASLLESWQEHSISLNEQFNRQQKRIAKPIQQLQESTAPEARDRLLLAVFATFQKNTALRELVNRAEPVDITQLRQAVRDYSEIDFSPLELFFLHELPIFLQRPKHKKTINQLTLNLDSFMHVQGNDHVKQSMVWHSAGRFVHLLQARGVTENQWRSIVVDLANCNLLQPSSLIYLWCRRCPEAGFTMATSLTKCDLPPICPSCGDDAHAVVTFVPAGPLRDAILAPDGLLGVAIAWHLRERKIRFDSAKHTGATEFDFVVGTKHGPILLECKMLHVLSENIMANLWTSRNQLRDHITALTVQGTPPFKAACIVNIPKRELRSLLANLSDEAADAFCNFRGEVISYEQFPKWLQFSMAAKNI
jgi:hypothetical protein